MKDLKQQIIDRIHECQDQIVLSNMLELMNRSIVGVKKYGVTLHEAGLSQAEILQHLREELLDASNYITTLQHANNSNLGD